MIPPPATLGMLGGCQLSRFFVLAEHEIGYCVLVLDPDAQIPPAAHRRSASAGTASYWHR
jgi:phosphoribosylaminoimidazole carboxylase (NCAIR synthetase)